MAAEGRGVRKVIRKRQTRHVIERQEREYTTTNDDGIRVPEKKEDSFCLIHHQPISNKVLDQPGAQRSKDDKQGWALSEQKIANENVIHIDGLKYTVKENQAFTTHTECMLVNSGPTSNKVDQ